MKILHACECIVVDIAAVEHQIPMVPVVGVYSGK